ncbi:c4-dicarboxylate anaerobic carrier [Lucifera butyrica]|uniref:C4-dicarboxylate anaerobic carrier n=1 Tax=Lucifera butyrica TaxID=1351585 RepID=A0A498R863_9FIRM|nr:C4-dicarboxylate transporter DcuC [Lucifera butyrica]VBB07110.1 c4-dicarboxylate anaerobic carrier [Lucifera butyrica]
MLSLVIALIVTLGVGYMLYKKYKPQGVLFAAGIILLFCAAIFGTSNIVTAKQSTGTVWLDIFVAAKLLFSSRLAGLGLTIMSIGGFVRYMENCGANKALVEMAAFPLKHVKSPMLIMVVAYIIGQIIDLFIPSHAGLGLLLMLTIYPIMVAGGLSKLTAVTIIATSKFTDIGPLSSNAILAATTAGLDPVTYFIKYQLYAVLPAIVVVGAAHYFAQPWWEKREKKFNINVFTEADESENQLDSNKKVPAIYAVLPMLPLFLVVIFSPFFHTGIKLDVVSAMILSTIVAMVFEFIFTHNAHLVLNDIMKFFEGMAKQFRVVVSLIISAELYGLGLVKIGAIDSLIALATGCSFSTHIIVLVIGLIMVMCAFIMGSGNAAFFAFASFAPKIAGVLHVDSVLILLPMELSAGFGRCMSPITAAIVAIASIAGVSPFHVAKRCAIPVILGFIVHMLAIYYYFL